ncbi:hypothetical protein HNQ64_003986 [Prosthecobacter dejongeii]|uniref:Uncharacterized protein n=1 Tax=Prosthecobacter dejongeii TaxID=48465 RepID=A0A7W8DSC8_9BACT|nr:hypothetical protein [Prosthecobacter dejongeii]
MVQVPDLQAGQAGAASFIMEEELQLVRVIRVAVTERRRNDFIGVLLVVRLADL